MVGAVMRASHMNIFVGVWMFAVAMLYFYVLTISIVVMFWGLLSGWFVASGWVLLLAVLYGDMKWRPRQTAKAE